jgi:hypothetical protein
MRREAWLERSRAGTLTLGFAVLGGISFALHFAWESIQCPLFFVHERIPPTWGRMIRATMGDIVLTGIAWLAVSLASRDALWFLGRWRWVHWAALISVGLALSILIEIYALRTERWSYAAEAPLLPGTEICLVPVVQLLVLLPASFALTRGALRRVEWPRA